MHLNFSNLAMFIVKALTQHMAITIRRSTMLVSLTVVRFNLGADNLASLAPQWQTPEPAILELLSNAL